MMPILLISKNAREINKYIADFVKKQSIIPSLIFQYRKNPHVIDIAQIREIQSHLSRASSVPRLFILYDFETARSEAQNAFLKTLEERGDSAYFILISPTEGLILPTVISRCTIRKLKISREAGSPQTGSYATRSAGKNEKLKITQKSKISLLFSTCTVTDREKAVQLCEEFLIILRDMMKDISSTLPITRILREILKTRRLILKNNLNSQIAIDHILFTVKKQPIPT